MLGPSGTPRPPPPAPKAGTYEPASTIRREMVKYARELTKATGERAGELLARRPELLKDWEERRRKGWMAYSVSERKDLLAWERRVKRAGRRPAGVMPAPAKIVAARKKHLEEARKARAAERAAGKRPHTIAYHLKQAEIARAKPPVTPKLPTKVIEKGKEVVVRGEKVTLPDIEAYDIDKIVADPALQKVFVKEVKGGRKILADLYKWQRTHTQTKTGEWYLKTDLADLKKDSPELYTTLIKKGTEAYEAEIARLRKEAGVETFVIKKWKERHTELPDGSWLSNYDLKRVKESNPEQYRILTTQGYDAYKKALKEAETTLEKHHYLITVYDEEGRPRIKKTTSINVMSAVRAGEEDAVRLLFGTDAVKEAKHYLNVEKKFDTEYKGDVRLAILADMPYSELSLLFKKKDLNKVYAEVKDFKAILGEYKDFKEKAKAGTLSFGEYLKQIFYLEPALQTHLAIVGAGLLAAELPKVRREISKAVESVPKAVKLPSEIAGRFMMGGLVAAPLYMSGFLLSVTGVISASNKAGYTKQVATGVASFFIGIPAMIAAEPMMASELAGVFISPVSAYKFLKTTAAKGSPFYLPNQGMRFSFTTGKIATKVGDIAKAIRAGKITEMAVERAVARAIDRALKNPKATARARIGNSNIFVVIEATPVSKQMGGILWHAAPERQAYRGLETIVEAKGKEPALFVSPHAAPRFALQAAHGTAATKPCLVMIYTKKGGLQWFPTNIQYAKSLATMKAKGFQYLGSGRAKPGAYPPIKTYLTRFENEAMLPNGMKIYRVRNLQSRILGARAGEFVTTCDGWVMPIFRFAERGAKIPHTTLATLAAIRIETMWHSLKVLFGKKGFKAEKVDTEALTKELDAIGKEAAKGKKGKAYDTAYEKAIDTAMVERIRRIYEPHRAALERAWRANPERFEAAYREHLTRHIARVYRVRMPRVAPARPLRYVTAHRDTRLERRLAQARVDRVDRLVRRPYKRYALRDLARYTPRDLYRDVPRMVLPREPRVSREPYEPPPRIPRIGRPPPPPPPPVLPRKRRAKKEKAKIAKRLAPIAWRQGFVWWVIYPPYKKRSDVRCLRKPPVGAKVLTGIGSAYKTIQALGGDVSVVLSIDMGAFDVEIRRPARAGKKGTIKFKRDVRQRTKSDISLIGVRV